MNPLRFSTLVLAGGKGTRMKSALPKVLHKACGRTLLAHVLETAREAGASRHVVVVGVGRDEVKAELASLSFATEDVWQEQQKGTGHAALTALPAFGGSVSLVVILNGDGPLLRAETLRAFVENHSKKKADLSLGVMELEIPFGYGRIVKKGGKPSAIVEEKEASEKEKKIKTVNGGLYAVSAKLLLQLLPRLQASKRTGEIYLTDIVALAAKAKKKLEAFPISSAELGGVNDLLQLAEAEAVLRRRRIEQWLKDGVRIEAPEAFWPDGNVICEPGAVLGPNVVLKGSTKIASGSVIEAGCVLIDSVVESGAVVKAYSHLEGAVVKGGAQIGPFARLRPGAAIGEEARIGNFVEVKKSVIGKGSKANHLSYIGDAEVGEGVNIGCGFVACNYDGVNKHKTTIEDGAFIGSNVNTVAPVTVGKDAYVATGSTVTRNVPDGALAVGRAKQENKEGYADRLRSRMQAAKKAKGKV
ncbi:MAG TPA: bifunctional UDP-N-acetylglucosamine diphosphorylase/glucosamine-1-phosphate N-acetyltransferase GlmU [Bdellovibrionota bacterium]|jgi:bifunctional UDP-N-acetylglucosamine pyrophosphorylase/glucosamine-1-phosphate N-acetyltransferase